MVIPVAYSVAGMEKETLLWALGAVALLAIVLDIVRLRLGVFRDLFLRMFQTLIRRHEVRSMAGATYLLGAAFLTVLLFPRPVAIAALYFAVVGDAVAALAGRGFGRTRLPWGKSLEGTLAFLGASILLGGLTPGLPWGAAIAGAAVATLAEALPLPIDDNLTIPLASGAVMILLVGP